MWSWLRANKSTRKIPAQPIGGYIVDFVSFEKKLIIEVAGGQHSFDDNRKTIKSEPNGLKHRVIV